MWPEMSFWGETQRMYYLANHLAQKGWQVFTVSPGHIREGGKEQKEKYYTAVFMGHKTLSCSPQSKKKNKTIRNAAKVRGLAFKLAEPAVQWFYNEPNCYEGIRKQLWMLKYQKAVYELIEKKNIRNVIISIPAFVLMKFGPEIKKRFPQVRVIYDYRDPWFLWNKKRGPAHRREKKYLSYADRIVGFTEIFRTDLISAMNIEEKKTATVCNGYSEKDWSAFEKANRTPCHPDSRKLRISYVGNITLADNKDNFRNPARLIAVMRQFPELELYFVGVDGDRVDTVDGNVHFVGRVGQTEAFRYMSESDVLVSIHDAGDCSGSYVISGKFFDYMRSGKVILHIGPPRDLMSEMVRKYHLGLTCENSEEELFRAARTLLEAWRCGTLQQLWDCPVSKIRPFSREYQNDVYDALLENLWERTK